MRRLAIALAFAAFAPGAIAAPGGPGPRELGQALAADRHSVRPTHVYCRSSAPDEPTEFRCSYRLARGVRCVTWIAVDGATWVTIETPACRIRRQPQPA